MAQTTIRHPISSSNVWKRDQSAVKLPRTTQVTVTALATAYTETTRLVFLLSISDCEMHEHGSGMTSGKPGNRYAGVPVARPQSRLLASAAPADNALSFAHATDEWIRPPIPQSVPAITFSRPTASA